MAVASLPFGNEAVLAVNFDQQTKLTVAQARLPLRGLWLCRRLLGSLSRLLGKDRRRVALVCVDVLGVGVLIGLDLRV
jgi:hypothetical protein